MIHRLGLAGARSDARSKLERRCIDVAAAMLDPPGEPSIMYGAPIGGALPRRSTTAQSSAVTAQADGLRYVLSSTIALPFGSVARLILIQLQTLAIETGARRFDFPHSLHAWGRDMGASMGGRSYETIARQSHLIGNTHLRIAPVGGGGETDFAFVDSLEFDHGDVRAPASLVERDFHDPGHLRRVTISAGFYDHARRHAHPLDGAALRLIQTSSWAVDLYVWLATRLPRLAETEVWDWATLAEELGAHYKHSERVKTNLMQAAALVLAVYATARIAGDKAGLTLHPSPPPIG